MISAEGNGGNGGNRNNRLFGRVLAYAQKREGTFGKMVGGALVSIGRRLQKYGEDFTAYKSEHAKLHEAQAKELVQCNDTLTGVKRDTGQIPELKRQADKIPQIHLNSEMTLENSKAAKAAGEKGATDMAEALETIKGVEAALSAELGGVALQGKALIAKLAENVDFLLRRFSDAAAAPKEEANVEAAVAAESAPAVPTASAPVEGPVQGAIQNVARAVSAEAGEENADIETRISDLEAYLPDLGVKLLASEDRTTTGRIISLETALADHGVEVPPTSDLESAVKALEFEAGKLAENAMPK